MRSQPQEQDTQSKPESSVDRQEFWKNFKLGEELQIAGRFIYNGLRCFHEMDNLYHYDEIFETLYNLSVGIERLSKVAIILTEHDSGVDQNDFESALITHDHQSLLLRLKKSRSINFPNVVNDMIAMLGTFYKSCRYDRYVLATMTNESKEKSLLHDFFEKHLKIVIKDEPPINVSMNTDQLRKFLGRTVGKICETLYDLIYKEARRNNTYTYEVRNGSKAAKIFMNKKYDFMEEDVLWREILIFLLNGDCSNGTSTFLRGVEPLDFDPGLMEDYFDCFKSTEKMLNCLDELDHLYSNLPSVQDRLSTIALVGVYLYEDEDEDEDDYGAGENG